MAWRWTVSPMWWTSRPRTKLDDSGNAPRAGMMTWFRKQSRIKTETHAEIGCSVTAMATVNAFSRSQVLGDPESWGFRVRSIFAREIWEATGSICFNIIHYIYIFVPYMYKLSIYVYIIIYYADRPMATIENLQTIELPAELDVPQIVWTLTH